MRYKTPAAGSTDGRYYQIDTAKAPSNFVSTVGTIDPASIEVNDYVGAGESKSQNTRMTFAEMQSYQFTFKTKHSIYQGDFVKVVMPRAFTVVYPSTTTA
jgi:hypothetical protein